MGRSTIDDALRSALGDADSAPGPPGQPPPRRPAGAAEFSRLGTGRRRASSPDRTKQRGCHHEARLSHMLGVAVIAILGYYVPWGPAFCQGPHPIGGAEVFVATK